MAEMYKDKIKFVRMNVLSSQENLDIAIRHGIRSVPALDFFYKGRHVETIFGFIQESHMRHILDEVLARHKERAKQSSDLDIKI